VLVGVLEPSRGSVQLRHAHDGRARRTGRASVRPMEARLQVADAMDGGLAQRAASRLVNRRVATGADALALARLQPSTTTTALASAEAVRHILTDHQFPSLPVDVEESGSIVTSMSTARLRPRPWRGVL